MHTDTTSRNERSHGVWPLISRITAAVFAGYALSNALAVAIMGALVDSRAGATMAAMELSFLVYAIAVLWAFAVRSVRVVWIGLLGATALAAAVAVLVV